MKGKIGLEEHFAIDETLLDPKGLFPDDVWASPAQPADRIHDRLR